VRRRDGLARIAADRLRRRRPGVLGPAGRRRAGIRRRRVRVRRRAVVLGRELTGLVVQDRVTADEQGGDDARGDEPAHWKTPWSMRPPPPRATWGTAETLCFFARCEVAVDGRRSLLGAVARRMIPERSATPPPM